MTGGFPPVIAFKVRLFAATARDSNGRAKGVVLRLERLESRFLRLDAVFLARYQWFAPDQEVYQSQRD